ncbi:MAG TPA: tetratricopeptide repeat protein, partial [Xanthobacteraceae bacterium]|nr:tetratricopeptide repeat protein [Xanthobacteraceae bacterium]
MSGRLLVIVLMLFLAACGDDKKKSEEHLAAGQKLAQQGKYDAALPEFQQAVELNKDSIDAMVALGNAYRHLKRYDDALDTFRAAKKVDRYVVKPHIASALTRVETGQVEMAIDELNHVIELDPKNLQAKILLGKVSMMPYRQDDGTVGVSKLSLERAQMNLEIAVQAAPDNLEAHQLLAKDYEALGLKDKAVKAWTDVKDLAAKKSDE